ncbi:unnamed protein product [Didymodactylos carnosus]|uniref:Reverse transcriptase domain-containing protein n=1 Tax=Didymodactylos carnosus TaxID=1234261 RepID=A0A814QUS8_9BILA|nr:unnamed protein product [Didymodactylos carnosus]CAF1123965.1 unnamed protein product [Didymodactylos carnosus]CAF3786582.1 unnamed protein product [Didymodactylos carnosus]CAF3887478.1 unnamed protein product [Didymodactylos carnosus]
MIRYTIKPSKAVVSVSLHQNSLNANDSRFPNIDHYNDDSATSVTKSSQRYQSNQRKTTIKNNDNNNDRNPKIKNKKKGLKFIPNKPFHLTNVFRHCITKLLSSSSSFTGITTDAFLLSAYSNRSEFIMNLPTDEQMALRSLQYYDDIITRPADKNVGIVVMQSSVYESKVLQQLNDREYYESLSYNPTNQTKQRIIFEVNQLFKKKLINFSTLKFIEPKNLSCGTFYILPKIHKKHCPERPIISGIDHLTSNISDYLERLLIPYVSLLQEYAMNDYPVQNYIVLKDTNHLLKEIELVDKKILNRNLNVQHLYMVTGDITSLYTNIPQDDGIQALSNFITNFGFLLDFPLSTSASSLLLDPILKNNFS